MSERVRPWEVKPGDRILGTTMRATGKAAYAGYVYADAVGQQRYMLPVMRLDGTEAAIPYADDSWVMVIRGGG